MDPFKAIDSRPRRFSLPLAAASGMALGFYPGPGFLVPAIALAVFLSASGWVVADLGKGRSPESAPGGLATELRGLQALAVAIGIVAGASIAWNEAGIGSSYSNQSTAPVVMPAEESGKVPSASSRGLVALRPAWAEGRLSSDSTPAKNGFTSYPLRVERLGYAGKGVSAEISYPAGRGGALRVLARSGPAMDSGSMIRALGFFPESAAQVSGIGAALFAQPRDIELIDRGGPIDRARSASRSAIRHCLARIGRSSAGLMQALILGIRDSLSPEEAEAFKGAGCSHILALSGEHLSVLAVLSIAVLRPLLGPFRARLAGAILASLFMWIAGPGPSLMRAVLMVWIGAIALALDRPQDRLAVLALVFLVILPLDPSSARSLSFTLSYLAVWGLAFLAPRFSFLLGRMLPPFLRESASASLAAQAAVSPLLAFCFGYLQFAGIFASMAAGPVVAGMMWWGMGAGFLCSFFPFAAPYAVPVSDLLYRILMTIMRASSSVPVLPLPSLAARAGASAVVVGLAALVYARPHAEYRAWLARLRFAPGPEGSPGVGRPGHVQALRPELPGK